MAEEEQSDSVFSSSAVESNSSEEEESNGPADFLSNNPEKEWLEFKLPAVPHPNNQAIITRSKQAFEIGRLFQEIKNSNPN